MWINWNTIDKRRFNNYRNRMTIISRNGTNQVSRIVRQSIDWIQDIIDSIVQAW